MLSQNNQLIHNPNYYNGNLLSMPGSYGKGCPYIDNRCGSRRNQTGMGNMVNNPGVRFDTGEGDATTDDGTSDEDNIEETGMGEGRKRRRRRPVREISANKTCKGAIRDSSLKLLNAVATPYKDLNKLIKAKTEQRLNNRKDPEPGTYKYFVQQNYKSIRDRKYSDLESTEAHIKTMKDIVESWKSNRGASATRRSKRNKTAKPLKLSRNWLRSLRKRKN